MNRTDANVTLMNRNDSSSLIKISHSSSAQDKPEGLNIELTAQILVKQKRKRRKRQRTTWGERRIEVLKKANKGCSLIRSRVLQ